MRSLLTNGEVGKHQVRQIICFVVATRTQSHRRGQDNSRLSATVPGYVQPVKAPSLCGSFRLSIKQDALPVNVVAPPTGPVCATGPASSRVISHSWRGRVYSFGTLITFCRPGTILHAPAQIGIKVRVPKPSGPYRKAEVTKDLVIWQTSGMTCWDDEHKPRNYPLAVIEWKVHDFKAQDHDIRWLTDFTGNCSTVGYAVALNLKASAQPLCCDRFAAGIREER